MYVSSDSAVVITVADLPLSEQYLRSRIGLTLVVVLALVLEAVRSEVGGLHSAGVNH